MKSLLLSTFLFCSLLLAENITVAVAANVSYAMDELKEEFRKTHPSINVRVVLGSSGKLTAQIKNGAPYGLFMSANMKYPENLFTQGIAITEPVVYAQGTLAYFSVKPRDLSDGVDLLKDKSIEKIAVANPKTAPYGAATMEALQNADLFQVLESKFVYAESISQTVSYAMTAADIGIIAKASLYSDRMKAYKEGYHWKEVDSQLYEPIRQGIVLLKNSKGIEAYRAFHAFVLGEKAKTIFKKYGYII